MLQGDSLFPLEGFAHGDCASELVPDAHGDCAPELVPDAHGDWVAFPNELFEDEPKSLASLKSFPPKELAELVESE